MKNYFLVTGLMITMAIPAYSTNSALDTLKQLGRIKAAQQEQDMCNIKFRTHKNATELTKCKAAVEERLTPEEKTMLDHMNKKRAEKAKERKKEAQKSQSQPTGPQYQSSESTDFSGADTIAGYAGAY